MFKNLVRASWLIGKRNSIFYSTIHLFFLFDIITGRRKKSISVVHPREKNTWVLLASYPLPFCFWDASVIFGKINITSWILKNEIITWKLSIYSLIISFKGLHPKRRRSLPPDRWLFFFYYYKSPFDFDQSRFYNIPQTLSA